MKKIKVTGEVILPAGDAGEDITTMFEESYTQRAGLRRMQSRSYEADSDFPAGSAVRYSDDNGRTWGPWEDVYAGVYSGAADGAWEILNHITYGKTYNPVHGHFVEVEMLRIMKGGHVAAYEAEWKGEFTVSDHCYLVVSGEEEAGEATFLRYEDGPELDPANPLSEEYFSRNNAYFCKPTVCPNGDILLPLGISSEKACRMLGADAEENGKNAAMIVARGAWNGKTYDLSFSRPVVICDRQSSRGVMEPTAAALESGRILVVFRGSNWLADHLRMEPGTPGFKWYCTSDDGGSTFTQPVPWHFDDGEVIYSASSISHLVRSEKNGRLYWIGNITDHHADGNYPRWPLYITEVDETYGLARKETLTMIDTKRDRESDKVQLSNFNILQDRETGNIELRLVKFGQLENRTYQAETWKYTIDVGE